MAEDMVAAMAAITTGEDNNTERGRAVSGPGLFRTFYLSALSFEPSS